MLLGIQQSRLVGRWALGGYAFEDTPVESGSEDDLYSVFECTVGAVADSRLSAFDKTGFFAISFSLWSTASIHALICSAHSSGLPRREFPKQSAQFSSPRPQD